MDQSLGSLLINSWLWSGVKAWLGLQLKKMKQAH